MFVILFLIVILNVEGAAPEHFGKNKKQKILSFPCLKHCIQEVLNKFPSQNVGIQYIVFVAKESYHPPASLGSPLTQTNQ